MGFKIINHVLFHDLSLPIFQNTEITHCRMETWTAFLVIPRISSLKGAVESHSPGG